MIEHAVHSSAEIVLDLSEKELIRVLHVDDEPSILKISKQCLEMQGSFQVDTASSVEEASEKMRKDAYDAVVSDYRMPGKDGLEFLKELRLSGNTVPFLIFTGKGREEVAIRALNLGADQYLNKIGDPEAVYCELSYAIRRTVERRKAEAALETLGERYRRLFESTVDGVVINGSDGRILSLNMAAVSILGYDNQDELIGRPAVELYADPTVRARLLVELLDRGCVKDRELTWKRKDGTLIEILASVTAQKDEKGNLLQTEGIIRDITEKKKAEKALEESEEKYKTLVEQSFQGILVAQGPVPHIVFANATMSKILGYTPKEMISFSPQQTLELVHPDDRELFFSRFKERLEGNSPLSNYIIRGFRKDGTIVWLELSSSRIDYDAKPAVQAMFMDITQRKKAEDELRESEEKFRTLFSEAMDAIFIADTESGVIVDCNQAAMKLVGKTKQELVGKHQRILHPEKATKNEGFTNTFQQHIGERQGQILEAQVITKTGEIKEVAIKGSIVELRGRKVLQGIFRDISEQKKAERTTLEIQQNFKALFAGNPEAAVHVGLNFCILDINPRFEMLFGYKLDEIKGRNINDVVVPKDKIDEAHKLDRKAEEDKHVSQATVRRKKDGSLVPVFVSAAPITVEGRFLGYVAMYNDISELKKVQEESEESRKHFQSLFNLMADPVAIVDSKGKVLDTTSRVHEITGFKKEELVGKNFLKLKMFSVGTKAAMMKSLAKRMIGMHMSPYEVEIITKNGRKLPYEINAAKIDYKGKPADLVVFHSISERKKLEEKLRVVGGLTRHDVRNKLSVITGNAFLLKMQLAGNSEALNKLKDMETAVQQVMRIFDFAKTYEMLGAEKLVYVDVEKAVDEAISLFSGVKDVEVVDDCHGLEVLADSLLRQLFYNLFDNSLKYGQKTTRIRTSYEQTSQEELRLVYEDDGVGIPAAEKPELFKEGYSTGGSTGCGLHMINKIVEVYGWKIEETGEPSKGARFVLTIPHMNLTGKENYQLRAC